MNFRKLGALLALLGLICAVGTYAYRSKLDAQYQNHSVNAFLADEGLPKEGHRMKAAKVKQEIEGLKPWLIAGGVVSVLGLIILVSAKSE